MGKSMAQIGSKYGLCRQTISSFRNSALNELRRLLTTETDIPANSNGPSSQNTFLIDDDFKKRFVLSVSLGGAASDQQVCNIFNMLFSEHSMSREYVRQTLKAASENCRKFNQQADHSRCKHLATDEIFNVGMPILAMVDNVSYYLMGIEPMFHRDTISWECMLSWFHDKNALNPTDLYCDGAQPMRSAAKQVFGENMTIHMDNMHHLQCITRIKTSHERRSTKFTQSVKEMEENNEARRLDSTLKPLSKKELNMLAVRRENADKAQETYTRYKILFDWLKDLLANGGYGYEDSLNLANWILDELLKVDGSTRNEAAIKKMRKQLPEAFIHIRQIDTLLSQMAETNSVSLDILKNIYHLRAMVPESQAYCGELKKLRQNMSSEESWNHAVNLVQFVLSSVKRASSWIESINSVLRLYMDNKRRVPDYYYDLIQTYLNVCPDFRTRRPDWKNTSPYERFTGVKSPDFLSIALGK